MTRCIRLCCQFAALTLLLSVLPTQLPARADAPRPADLLLEPGGAMRWAVWNPTLYALADDGEAIWIGATGGIVRFDKATRSHQRFTTLDGLPHTKVLAVAVDSQGNRWFGGDGGLTVLWANGRWQQFDITNSGLRHDLVDGIAVAADDTLWLSHGLPYGAVSRRNPDGTWDWFPNRETAVVGDFDRVLTTRNRNRLWTPARDTVWVDWAAFDGSTWHERTPPGVTARPETTVADSQGRVWALTRTTTGIGTLRRWGQAGWTKIQLCTPTAFDIDATDQVWVGDQDSTEPPHIYIWNVLSRLNDELECVSVAGVGNGVGVVDAVLATSSGVWAIGPGWLVAPDFLTYTMRDQPVHPVITAALNDGGGLAWIYSSQPDPLNRRGILQAVDDLATSAIEDDIWHEREALSMVKLSALDRTPSGDLWVQGIYYFGKGTQPTGPLLRHNGAWVDFFRPFFEYRDSYGPFSASDIYAENDRTTWFTADFLMMDLTCRPSAILRHDNGGTPEQLEDDVWTSYPAPPNVVDPSLVVDSLGQIWLGDTNGLYRLSGTTWQEIKSNYGEPLSVCDLVALPDGIVIALDCASDYPYFIQSNTAYRYYVDSIIWHEIAQIRMVSHRINKMWSVGPDGRVWYIEHYSWQGNGRLVGYHETGNISYPLPVPASEIDFLHVASNNHLWLAAADNLWRLAPRPDFHVDAGSAGWLLAPGQQRSRLTPILRQEGFARPVSLQVTGLPEGITAEIQPNPVAANEVVRITFSVSPQTSPGEYTATLHAESVLITHETPLRIIVAADVHEHWLPLIAR